MNRPKVKSPNPGEQTRLISPLTVQSPFRRGRPVEQLLDDPRFAGTVRRGWIAEASGSAMIVCSQDSLEPFNQHQTSSLRVITDCHGDDLAGLANACSAGIKVACGQRLQFRAIVKGSIRQWAVALISSAGDVIATQGLDPMTSQWQPFEAVLTAETSDHASWLLLAFKGTGACWLGHSSLHKIETPVSARHNHVRRIP
jgi:hypothetical protein